MANDTTPQLYPFTAYNFRVNVGSNTMSFTEVSGIEKVYDHVVYRHGLSDWLGEQIATFSFDAFVPITMKRGVIRHADPLFLYDWLTKRDLRPVEILLCNADGCPVLRWTLAYAVPVKLSAPTFDANTNDVVVETVELQARGVKFGYA